jgi:hypothetical protein
LTADTGGEFGGVIYVGDFAVFADGDQRVEAGFEQAPCVQRSFAQLFFGVFPCRDVAGRGKDSFHLPSLVGEYRSVI